MAHAPEIIDLDDDSDELNTSMRRPLTLQEIDALLDDEEDAWGNGYRMDFNDIAPPPPAVHYDFADPLVDLEEGIMDRPSLTVGPHAGPSAPAEHLPQRPRARTPARTSESIASPALPSYERCLTEILELFPDISHDHAKKLYDAEVEAPRQGGSPLTIARDLIEKILDKGKYPKEKDRLNELKRKRLRDSDEEELAELRNAEPGNPSTGNSPYWNISKMVLQEDFANVPQQFIDLKFKESGQFFKTYQALETAERDREATKNPLYQKLKRPRKKLWPPGELDRYIDKMASQGYGIVELKREIAAARKQRKKEDDKRQGQKDKAEAEKAKEKLFIDRGDVMTCGICMDDTIPIYKIIHCNNEKMSHFSCLDCIQSYAESLIGTQGWELTCCDTAGCDATFSRSQKEKALDAKTMETLDRLQQQAEIKQAGMEGLSHCPFCHFAAICPPIEVDWEFRCGNPSCEKVTCRRCDKETHAPKTCKEAKEEHGLDERHEIEEARTAALIKKCPGCGRAVIKDGGCNKVRCQCDRTICDVCGKDVSKESYNHFSGGGGIEDRIPGKCPLYDDSAGRLEKGIQAAEDRAMKKIREENPDISAEDLRIKFKKEVQGGNISANGPFVRHMGFVPGGIGGLMPPGHPGIAVYGAYGPPVYAHGAPNGPGYGPPIRAQAMMHYPYGALQAPQAPQALQAPQAPQAHVAPGLMPPLMGNFGVRRRHAPNVQPPQAQAPQNNAQVMRPDGRRNADPPTGTHPVPVPRRQNAYVEQRPLQGNGRQLGGNARLEVLARLGGVNITGGSRGASRRR